MRPVARSDPGTFRSLLRDARAQHRAGAGAVLDILLRSYGDAGELRSELVQRAGVAMLPDDAPVQPDFQQWSLQDARLNRCVVLRNGVAGLVWAAAEDPWDESLMQQVACSLGTHPIPVAASRAAVRTWLGEPAAEQRPDAGIDTPSVTTAEPALRFVRQVLSAAHQVGASDVHFETDRVGVAAKHRLDGVLVRHGRLDGGLEAQQVISCIKEWAQLDIAEHRLPQDGWGRYRTEGIELDLRVSIVPSLHGENAVLRLLGHSHAHCSGTDVTLDRLGFDAATAGGIRALAAAPGGMLLVAGPTGSGKTTTVYAALSEIATDEQKIVSIEDPVAYELPRVMQIPVDERNGLTFARGLRSILHHDADRILVGELRDAETAEIAVQSALTGHSVYSTLHAAGLCDAVERFRQFGLNMPVFMSALNGIVVQRLLRRLCVCARTAPATPAERTWLGMAIEEGDAELRHAAGCPACRGTGYGGRFVLAELHTVDDGLRELVADAAPLSALKRHAGNAGIQPLIAQARGLVLQGLTTAEEARRAVGNG